MGGSVPRSCSTRARQLDAAGGCKAFGELRLSEMCPPRHYYVQRSDEQKGAGAS